MIKHYLKGVFRHIQKQKINSTINILGLSLGVGIVLFIWSFILYELSYDKFFSDHDRIFRVQTKAILGQGEPIRVPTAIYPLGEEALRDFPEVEEFVRMTTYFMHPQVTVDERAIFLSNVYFADTTFFSVFSYEFLAGDQEQALSDNNALVLSVSTASRLFDDPFDGLYQMVDLEGERYQITGIVEDPPDNSHITFSAIANIYKVPSQVKISGTNFYTYLKLHDNTDTNLLEEKLNSLGARLIDENPLYEGLSFSLIHTLIRLTDIHLHSNLIWEIKESGNYRNLRLFGVLSLFIILVAIINYVNLATAKSMLRAKEIGVRKVAGASRGTLIRQIMMESLVITAICFLIAFLVAELLNALFLQHTGVEGNMNILLSPPGILTVLSVFILTAVLSGLYPAFYLSSFDAVKILKGETLKGTKGKWFRRVLVTFQFTITLFVISSLWVVSSQTNYMMKQNPGFDRENVLVVRNLSSTLSQSFPALKSELFNLSSVNGVSGTTFLFGGHNRVDLVAEVGVAKETGVTSDIIYVDQDFFDVMGIQLAEGRFFYPDSDMDLHSAFILNQRAVRALGFEDPIHKELDLFGTTGPLVGIVEDFHFKSLHDEIGPLAIINARSGFPHVFLKVATEDILSLQLAVSEVLQSFDPAYIPDMMFLDEGIRHEYSQEQQSTQLLTAGAMLALFISLLGVYGLAAFAAERRTKEIGIRIVLGASAGKLIWLFNKESVILSAIAFIFAFPLTWLIMGRWLDNFAYRITINPLWILIAGVVVLLISSMIISIQTWVTARSNPVNALRSE